MAGWPASRFRNDYRNKIEAGTVPLQRINNGKTDVYQWENVPKAVVEGLEGTLNVPVSDTVNWTNNVTYMLQAKTKRPANACRLFHSTRLTQP